MLIGVAPIKEAFEFEHQESQRGTQGGSFVCGHVGQSDKRILRKIPQFTYLL